MKALIMAAGYGERMRPLSNRRPKPLLPVVGKALIDYVVEQLTTAGITEVGINTHHCAQSVVEHLQKRFSGALEMVFSHEEIIRGTGGGMRGLRDFLTGGEPFLVHNGDVVSTVHIPEVITFHRQHAPLVTMVFVDYAPVNSVTVSAEGSVVDFHARRAVFRQPGNYRDLTFTGISVVDPAILTLIPATIPYNIIDLYSELIKASPGSIQGFIPHQTYWIDVGTPDSYFRVHRDILLGSNAPVPGHGTERTGVYEGARCFIDATARFDGFVSLGENCRIGANAYLNNCIVWDNSQIESGTHCENGVVDGPWSYQLT